MTSIPRWSLSAETAKMPKERNYNPVQAQRKADKARAIKKGKAEVQERRNERLARKNPECIQKHIDELQAVAANGAQLTRHEEQVLEGLRKELRAVGRAREALGDRATAAGPWRNADAGPGLLGKCRRASGGASSGDDDDVPDDVRRIPMPRDTPPPIPRDVLDRWHARWRARRGGGGPAGAEQRPATPPPAPVEAHTVYEAKPIMRDLRQEAVAAFVPAAVQVKMRKGRGQDALLEPDEADRLEQEGYLPTSAAAAAGRDPGPGPASRRATAEDAGEDGRATGGGGDSF